MRYPLSDNKARVHLLSVASRRGMRKENQTRLGGLDHAGLRGRSCRDFPKLNNTQPPAGQRDQSLTPITHRLADRSSNLIETSLSHWSLKVHAVPARAQAPDEILHRDDVFSSYCFMMIDNHSRDRAEPGGTLSFFLVELKTIIRPVPCY